MSLFSPQVFLSNYLDEPIFIVDDLNFLMLIKMLWTVVCRGNKTNDLVSKKSTFCLECFLEDYKDRNKKFDEWRKVQRRYRDSTSYGNIFLPTITDSLKIQLI